MKTRLSAMAVVISSISMLTACSGGSSGPGTFTAPPITVTVTAPATAPAGAAFNVTWASTNATSCSSSDLTGVGATSGSVSQTETAAATKTYSVTCTGFAGSTTGTATVVVTAAVSAEGAWQGTTDNGRAVSGVVTKEGDYWLTYTQAGNNTVVGFYTGNGKSTATSSTAGTFASTSTPDNFREINFAGGFSGGGNVGAGTFDSGLFTTKTSFAAAFNAISGGAGPTVTFTGITSIGFVGSPAGQTNNYTNITGSGGSATISSLDGPATLTIHNVSSVVAINPTYASGATDSATIVSDEVFNGTISGGVFTPTNDGTGYSTALSCTPINVPVANQVCGGVTIGAPVYYKVPAGGTGVGVGGTLNLATGTTTVTTPLFNRVSASGAIMKKTIYTFAAPSSVSSPIPSITTSGTFTSAYNTAYESTPTLATVAGSYTAGSTGIGITMHADASLTIDASTGAIIGTETATFCNYTATIAPHATGNVYDVTAITFSNAAGGTCAYTGQTMTGVATYAAGKLTLTATNAARDKGFLVVATH